MQENEAFAEFITSRIDASKDVENSGKSGLEGDEKKAGQKTRISQKLKNNDVNGSLSTEVK